MQNDRFLFAFQISPSSEQHINMVFYMQHIVFFAYLNSCLLLLFVLTQKVNKKVKAQSASLKKRALTD
jgi:hypothetical protein